MDKQDRQETWNEHKGNMGVEKGTYAHKHREGNRTETQGEPKWTRRLHKTNGAD